MTITPVEGHGFFYNGESYSVGQYGPGEQPEDPPFREAPHLRIVTNSNDVGELHSGGVLNRHPIDQSRIAGGGTRNESIRPLPINPEGPWL